MSRILRFILLAEVLLAVFSAEPGTGPADNAVARRIGLPTAIAGISPTWSGICTICTICTSSSSTDGSSTDTYRHSTGHGCTTINSSTIGATAIDSTVMNASMTNGNASSICEGVS